MIKRDILDKIMPWVGKDKIIIIKGSRQVGKTVLLRQIEQKIKEADNSAVVAYLAADDLDNRRFFQSPDALGLYLKETCGFPAKRIFLMIDEFQAIPQAGAFLKNMHDRRHGNPQIIVSGSSSLEISKNSEFLTGRALNFVLERVSFTEFAEHALGLKGKNFSLGDWPALELFYQTFGGKLELLLGEYLAYGGYPEVITTALAEHKRTILNAIVQTYIEKDIIHFLRVENVGGFNALLKLLAEQSGNLVNFHELSNTLRMSSNTVKKYIEMLTGTYVLNFARPFSSNRRIEITKMPKVYLLDLGLRNYLLRSFEPEIAADGKAIENFIYLSLLSRRAPEKIHFYRTIAGAEIDFVVEEENGALTLCEVKYRAKISGVPAAMKNMAERYRPRATRQIIVTKQTLFKDKKMLCLPAVVLPFIRLGDGDI